jgi:hypothetical protein
MTEPDGDQAREELKPTCEGMLTGMPGPVDEDDDQEDEDT